MPNRNNYFFPSISIKASFASFQSVLLSPLAKQQCTQQSFEREHGAQPLQGCSQISGSSLSLLAENRQAILNNHGMVWVGRVLKDYLVPFHPPWAATSSPRPDCSNLHHTSSDAAQDTTGFMSCQCTSLTHIQDQVFLQFVLAILFCFYLVVVFGMGKRGSW